MKILKVKITQSGYKLNDSIDIPKSTNNKDYRAIQKWIAAGGEVEPEYSDSEIIAQAKTKKKEQVNQQREKNKNANVLYKIRGVDYSFQRDIISQLAFINAIVSLDNVAVSRWVTADNSIVDIKKSDLISICAHIKQRDDVEHYQARKRKDAIESLESLEDIESYDIKTIYE